MFEWINVFSQLGRVVTYRLLSLYIDVWILVFIELEKNRGLLSKLLSLTCMLEDEEF